MRRAERRTYLWDGNTRTNAMNLNTVNLDAITYMFEAELASFGKPGLPQ